MLAEVGRAEEGHGAELAGEGLRVRVGVHVCLQVTALGERLVAHAALMRPNIKKFRCRNSSITNLFIHPHSQTQILGPFENINLKFILTRLAKSIPPAT